MIAKVAARKWDLYGGTCRNCGAKTQGDWNVRREFCHRPECKSVQRQILARTQSWKFNREEPPVEEHKWAHRTTTVKSKGRYRLFCTCGWQSEWSEDMEVLHQQSKEHTGLKEKQPRRPDRG